MAYLFTINSKAIVYYVPALLLCIFICPVRHIGHTDRCAANFHLSQPFPFRSGISISARPIYMWRQRPFTILAHHKDQWPVPVKSGQIEIDATVNKWP